MSVNRFRRVDKIELARSRRHGVEVEKLGAVHTSEPCSVWASFATKYSRTTSVANIEKGRW